MLPTPLSRTVTGYSIERNRVREDFNATRPRAFAGNLARAPGLPADFLIRATGVADAAGIATVTYFTSPCWSASRSTHFANQGLPQSLIAGAKENCDNPAVPLRTNDDRVSLSGSKSSHPAALAHRGKRARGWLKRRRPPPRSFHRSRRSRKSTFFGSPPA